MFFQLRPAPTTTAMAATSTPLILDNALEDNTQEKKVDALRDRAFSPERDDEVNEVDEVDEVDEVNKVDEEEEV